MEKKSAITFNQARVALARQWMGAVEGEIRKEMTLKVLDSIAQGIVFPEKKTDKTETIPIPPTAVEAEKIIGKFERGAEGVREDKSVADTVTQHRLRDKTALQDEKWLGTEEEELNA
jgi:phospholipase D1/2